VSCCSGCLEILFLRLLYGAGRFICLMAVYAQFLDGSPSIISAALIPAVRGVSGCRACIGFVSGLPVCCLSLGWCLVLRGGVLV
jgi:hypothetical protein